VWEDWSLTAKLLTIMMALLLLVLTGTSAWVLENLRGSLISRTDDRLQSAAQALAQQAANEVFANPPLAAADSQNGVTADSLRKLLPANYYVQFYDARGQRAFKPVGPDSDNVPSLPAVDDKTVESQGGRPFTVNGSRGQWRVVALGVNKTDFNVAVAIPFDRDVDQITTYARNSSLGIGLLAMAIVAGVGYFAITNTFRPLKDIETTAGRIAAGDLTQRVTEYPPGTELGRLSKSLNTMLGQIETSFDGRTQSEKKMRQFVSDASHELRTPLVTIRGYAELYRQGALRTDEQVGMAMERIESEAKRMGVLVEDLVALARLDEHRPQETGPVDVGRIMQDAAADAVAQAPDRDISFIGLDGGDAQPIPPVLGDEAKLRQVIVNLAANAVRHTPGGTAIEFAIGTLDPTDRGPAGGSGPRPGPAGPQGGAGVPAVQAPPRPTAKPKAPKQGSKNTAILGKWGSRQNTGKQGTGDQRPAGGAAPAAQIPAGWARLEIRDHGEGISREDAKKIFERFYRVDASRTRDTGGSGLGLSIVKAIVENHRGRISVLDTPGGGATFRVDLPVGGGHDTMRKDEA
jgi:two-component system OmpR family sensor kinase